MTVYINGTTGISGVDGSAGTPAVQGSDTDTGMWFPAANTVAWSTGGSERMRVDSSGNVGINTSSPSYKLDINAGNAASFARIATSASNNGAGLILAGAFSGQKNWVIANQYNVNGSLEFTQTTAAGGSTIGTTPSMVIDSSGNLLVGTTSTSTTANSGLKMLIAADGANTAKYSVVTSASTNSTYSYMHYSTGASAYRMYVGDGGTIYATSTTITAISDQRLKENIRDLDDGLDVVMALKPRKFDWKEGKGASIKNARGFIAQEFEQVLPDMIEEWLDPAPEGEEPYKAVNANLIPTLVKAIQEQQALITALTERITALEAK